jgi:hypothetical protein
MPAKNEHDVNVGWLFANFKALGKAGVEKFLVNLTRNGYEFDEQENLSALRTIING